MAIVKKYYHMEEAIARAADQNLRRDQRKGLESRSPDEETLQMYLEEAKTLLEDTGENYLPEYPDTAHICFSRNVVIYDKDSHINSAFLARQLHKLP